MLDGGEAILEQAGAVVFMRPPERFDALSRRVPPAGSRASHGGATHAEALRRLAELNACVGDFKAGLDLFELAQQQKAFSASWVPTACRDAGRALARFRAALQAITAALSEDPAARDAKRDIGRVERRFSEVFPASRRKPADSAQPCAVRHRDIEDAGPLDDVLLAGRSATYLGCEPPIRFDLGRDTLWRLVALRDAAFAVFEDP